MIQTLKLARRSAIVAGVAGAVLLSSNALAAGKNRLDISLETAPGHFINVAVSKFVKNVNERSNDRVEARVFHSSSLHKGKDVPTALAQGSLDMGVIINAHLSKVVPEAGMTSLPMFYGQPDNVIYSVLDGPAGQYVAKKAAKKMNVHTLRGSWGVYVELYTVKKQILKPQDLKGMKFRIPGGAAGAAMFKKIGAIPLSVAHSDVPQAIQRGTIDGLMSHQEAYNAGKYHELGVKYALIDNGLFYWYLPSISTKSWNKYPDDIKKIIAEEWYKIASDLRQGQKDVMAKAQVKNAKNGLVTSYAKASDLKALREMLLPGQDALVKELKMDADFINMVKGELEKAQ